MKRVLSWIVLWLISCVVGIVTAIVTLLAGVALERTLELSLLAQIIRFVLFGATFITLVFAPAHWGALLAVIASEAVSNSKKGTRYIVFSVLAMLDLIASFILYLANGDIKIGLLLMCVYYIFLIIYGRATTAGDE